MSAPLPRLRRDEEAGRPSRDLIDGWLRVFTGLLRMPAGEVEGIREELEGHLRDRVRDLMVTGMDEAAAVRQAISELGEAAEVAARYRDWRGEPRRRLIMHLTLVGTGAALAMSLVALTWNGGQAGAPQAPGATGTMIGGVAGEGLKGQGGETPRAQDAAMFRAEPVDPQLAAVRLEASFDGTPLTDVFTALGKAAGRPVQVQRTVVEEAGADLNARVNLRYADITLPRVLAAASEQLGLSGAGALDARVTDGSLEIATREYFDRRELSLATYDLSAIIAARQAKYSEKRTEVVPEIVHALTEFVSPEDWVENGGELAQLQVVGDRLFVKAPARMHPQIRWMLRQLPPHGRAAGVDVDRPPVVYLTGEAERPGAYAIPAGQSLTLRRLLAASGGLKPGAAEVVIQRGDERSQTVQYRRVTAEELGTPGGPDVELGANDLVTVR